MRKIIMALVMTGSAVAAHSAVDEIYVRHTGGDDAVAISAMSHVEFPAEGGVSVVMKDGTTKQYSSDMFVSLRFTRITADIPSDVLSDVTGFYCDGDVLYSDAEGITVYSMDGYAVLSAAGNRLFLGELPAGVYVAVSGSRTLKFARK